MNKGKKKYWKYLQVYDYVLEDAPGQASIAECTIKLISEDLVGTKAYPIPHAMRELSNREVEKMLKVDAIETSSSPHSSPFALVKKGTGMIS